MRAAFLSIFGVFFLPSMCIAVCHLVTDWSDCIQLDANATKCGDGYRERKYSASCKPQIVFLPCSTCKDCSYSSWTEWSPCNQFCETGQQYSFRLVERYPLSTGKKCVNLVRSQDCNNQDCPKDCKVKDWSDWSNCHLPNNDTIVVTCSDETQHGLQTREREVTQVSSKRPGVDEACPDDKQSRYCNAFPCKIDCDQSSWGDWSECSASCGTASRRRTNHIKHQSQNGGADCGPIEEVESCDNYDCDFGDLMEDCEEKERPQFLLLPDVCPNDVVYCPGRKAKGYVKSCPEGQAWDSRDWECVDEDDICEDGNLKDHHYYGRYRHGYKRHGYGNRHNRGGYGRYGNRHNRGGYGRYGNRHNRGGYGRYGHNNGYRPFRPYGQGLYPQPLPLSPAYKPFSVAFPSAQNYYPQSPLTPPAYEPFPVAPQSGDNYYPQEPAQSGQNYYPQEPAQSGQNYYPQEPAQSGQNYPQQAPQSGQNYYPQESAQSGQKFYPPQATPSGKKFRGDPPSFLCQSEGEFRTGECNTFWRCQAGQHSRYTRCPNNQKFQESSPTKGRCDTTQFCN